MNISDLRVLSGKFEVLCKILTMRFLNVMLRNTRFGNTQIRNPCLTAMEIFYERQKLNSTRANSSSFICSQQGIILQY